MMWRSKFVEKLVLDMLVAGTLDYTCLLFDVERVSNESEHQHVMMASRE